MRVFVKNLRNEPLMPTTPTKARRLLKDGKAKVISRCPFVIKLTSATGEAKQELTLGIDTGSAKVGSAVVNEKNEVVYQSEIEIRNDITDKMKQRAKYRRNRRNRKTRYRQARWLNRANSIKNNRFSPTMTSKINSHLKEIKFVKSILPITNITIETATFDSHLLKNPEVKGVEYQKGLNYGFANTKAYVLDRDGYVCQNCKAKNTTLHAHHIIYRSNGGSDDESNLITLCKDCHNKVHNGEIELKKIGKKKIQLKHSTQMNSIRKQLLKQMPEAKETFGYITKEHRYLLNLSKEHYNDAVAIACLNNIEKTGLLEVKTLNTVILKKSVSKGDYQLSKGVRSEQKIPTGKIKGFTKFDKVEYMGKEYFIKGRMSSGYCILMDIDGKKIDFTDAPKGMKTAKLSNCKRLTARKSVITTIKRLISPT